MKTKKLCYLVLVLAVLTIASATMVACSTGKAGDVSVDVTYVVDGEAVRTVTLDGFSKINGFYKPTKTGYTFEGWCVDADLTIKFASPDQIKDNLVLYAKFTRKSFTVDFFGENGALLDSQTVFYSESAHAPEAPVISGKKFVGWSEDFSSVTSALSVYALYEEVDKYTAKFASLGKFYWEYEFEAGAYTDIIFNTALDKLDVPSGLRFVKWATVDGQELPTVFPASNVQFKAVYEMIDIEYLEIVSTGADYDYLTYAPDASITYGIDMPIYSDPDFNIIYSYEWSINGVQQDGTANTLTVSGLDVGTYEIKVVASAYGQSVGTVTKEAALTLTITPANMEVTATGAEITYDGNTHNITVNSLLGDVVEYKLADGEWTSSLDLVNAGTYEVYYKVSRDNYNTYESATPTIVTINKKEVVGTIAPTSLVYGDSIPTTFDVTYTGFVGNDDENVFSGSPVFTPAVQDALTIGSFGVAVDASAMNAVNYTVTISGGIINVAKKDLTVTADDQTITYCDDVVYYSLSYDGFIAGESANDLDVAPTGSSSHLWNSPVGQYEIVVSGGEDAHYNFIYVSGTLTVEKKIVTITAKDVTVPYGTAFEDIPFSYSPSDFIRDEITVTYTAPDYSVTLGAGNVVDIIPYAESENYEYWFAKGKLTVAQRALYATADDITVTFGDSIARYPVIFDGFVNGEDASVLDEYPTPSCGYTTGHTGAGSYDIILIGGVDDNYNVIKASGTLTVLKKDATVTVNPATVVYGDALPALSATVDGQLATCSVQYSLSSDYVAGTTPVGECTITAILDENPNYNVTVVDGTLTVTAREIAYTLSAETASVWSNSVWTNTNLVPGHVASGTLTFTGTELGTYTYPDGFEWTTDFDVKANGESVLSNYTVSFNVTVALIERDFEFTAEDKYVTYNGQAQSIEVTGVILSEDASSQDYTIQYKTSDGVWSTTVPTFVNAGDYAVSYRITPADSIYYPDVAEGTFTLHVSTKELTAVVDDKSKTYGEDNPTFTGTLTGVVEGEIVEINYHLANNADGKNAGAYAITASFAEAQPNYTLVVTDGTLTVGQKDVTITANDMAITYGDAISLNEHGNVTEGTVYGDTISVTYSTDYVVGAGVGEYDITPAFNGTYANYNVTLVDGTLTVGKKSASVKADSKSVVYGDTAPALTAVVTGTYVDDVLSYTLTCDYTAGATGVGTVEIVVTLDDNPNYSVTANDGTLTVTARPVTVKVVDVTVAYGDDVSLPEPTINGAVEGCPVNYSLSSDYSVGDNAGTTHAIVVTFGDNPNYSVTATNGTLTVVKADYKNITHSVVEGGVYSPNKTLADHALSAGYSWADSTINPTVGNTGYAVIYNADPANYNDFALTAKVNLSKAPVTIGGSTTQTIETTANSKYTFDATALTVSYNGTALSGAFEFTGILTYTVASTYQFTVVLSHQNYEGSALCTYIIKSVDVGGTLYTIEDALNVATSGNVIVKANTAFSNIAGYYNGDNYYTVKSGVTLLLPYKDGDTIGYLSGGEDGDDNYAAHPNYKNGTNIYTVALYVSLDVPSSVSITVNGALTVGAMTGKQDAGTKQNAISGGYAQINLNGNMTLNSATLRVIGYIKGNGTITANNSAIIENLYLSGWMGGTQSVSKYIGDQSLSATKFISGGSVTVSDPYAFPFNQYELRSIQSNLVINYGSSLSGWLKIATGGKSYAGLVNLKAKVNETTVVFISSDASNAGSATLRLIDSSAKITKSFANDRVKFTLDGNVEDGYCSMSIKTLEATVSVTSDTVLFPIDGRTDIVVNSGTFTQSYKFKLMPGATITVNSGATYTLNSSGQLIAYTSDFVDNTTYPYPSSSRGDAKVIVNGTFNLNGAFGGVVRSSANGGKVVVGSGATLSVTSNESIADGSTMDVDAGMIINAKVIFTVGKSSVTKSATLSNGTAMAQGTTYTYNGSTWA